MRRFPHAHKSRRWRQPVSLKFGKVGKRREVPHPVDVHMAHQMIAFVLYDPREETFRDQLLTLSMPIEGIDAKLVVARHSSPQVRNAQASLPIFDRGFIQNRD